ncbi:Uncharacterized protein dnl_62080 [Desulfonema limicola]|uniref:Uncharacterized protein n=1 Tax=Desulfonema limicola TaxID=45656 RepID=A0A975BE95_9BACT|nr:hypothetical protein [Desulfonema limicola]QTA83792.1 Uncharacterized protein dnl_62080 [Desulfonema limicola]
MAKITVYDKVSWHYPEGKNCQSIEVAKVHFVAVMKWLKENNLLSDDGKEIFGIGVDADFSITSPMLNEKGNDVLKKHYSNWLKTVDYSKKIDLKILDDELRKYKNS